MRSMLGRALPSKYDELGTQVFSGGFSTHGGMCLFPEPPTSAPKIVEPLTVTSRGSHCFQSTISLILVL